MNNFLKNSPSSISKFHDRGRRGQTMLLMVLVLTASLLSVAMISGLVMLFQIRQSGDFTNSAEAIFAAETGAEWWRMTKRKPAIVIPTSDEINAILRADNDSSFEIFPVAGNPNQVKIIGTSGNSKRALLVTIQIPRGILLCDKEQQIDLVTIIDRPVTLTNTNYIKTAFLDFVNEIMDSPTANVHIGVTQVGSSINVENQITGSYAVVTNSISSLTPYSLTPFLLDSAVADAISQLEDPLLDRSDISTPDAILVIADSMPSNPVDTRIEIENAKNKNIKIYTVKIGSLADGGLFEELSTGAGYYFESNSFADLQTTLVNSLLGCPVSP